MIDSVVCVLFDPSTDVPEFSRCYSEIWVDRLARGVRRNLSHPVEFVCLTDRPRKFEEDVRVELLTGENSGWGNIAEIWRPGLGLGRTMFLGLDTIIVGSLDELTDTPLDSIAVPWDPFFPQKICNAVVIYGEEDADRLWAEWNKGDRPTGIQGKISEMEFLRRLHDRDVKDERYWQIFDLFAPNQLLSYKQHYGKAQVLARMDARIVYFHGRPKPHELRESHPLVKAWKEGER